MAGIKSHEGKILKDAYNQETKGKKSTTAKKPIVKVVTSLEQRELTKPEEPKEHFDM